jgi:hypothetical protein
LLRLVLLGLAAYTDRDGTARPSIAQLADVTGLGERTVRARLRAAERADLIYVHNLAGGRGRTPVRSPGKAARTGAVFSDPKGGTHGDRLSPGQKAARDVPEDPERRQGTP